jgi:hypothetical protein
MTSDPLSVEAILERGETVYCLSWDTGGPGGGAGVERVYVLDGFYAVALDQGGSFGPYKSLREAIINNEQLHWIGPATTEIESTEFSIAEIEPLLKPFEGLEEHALELNINGERRSVKIT